MMTFKRGMAIGAMTLLAAGNAGAATLYTAPADAQFTDQIIGCRVTNVSASPRHVHIELRSFGGTIVSSINVVASPGATVGNADDNDGAYCKFIVDGSAKHVHAAAVYYSNDDANPGTVTATVPAQ